MFAQPRSARPLCPLLALAVVLASNAFAADYSWTNAAGGSWSQSSNWSPNGVPTSADSVSISLNASYTVTAPFANSVANLTLNAPLATLLLPSSDTLGSASLSAYPITITAGHLRLAPANNYSVSVAGSSLNVGAAGFVDMPAPSSSLGTVVLSADVNNNGTITDSTTTTITGLFTNNGAYALGTPSAASTLATVQGNGAFLQAAGNLTLQNNATLKLANTAFIFSGGAINNSSVANLSTGLAPADGGAIVLTGNAGLSTTIADGHGAVFNACNNLTLVSDFSYNTGLVLEANSNFGSALLNLPTPFTNRGEISLRSDDGYAATVNVNNGDGDFVNAGILATDSNAGRYAVINGRFVNTGTVLAFSDLTLNANASNQGDIHLSNGTSLRMSNARFNQDAGTLGDNLSTTFVIHNGAFNFNGGQINTRISLNDNSSLSTSTPDGHGAVFVAYNTPHLSGDLAANTSLGVYADSAHSGALLNVDTNATNYGALTLFANDGYGATLNGNFINAGTLSFNTSTAGSATMNGTLVNTGTLNVGLPLLMKANASNAGTLNLAANASISMTNARFNQDSGALGNDGSTQFLIVNGGFNYNGGQVKLTVYTAGDSYLSTSVPDGAGAAFNMYGTGRLHGNLANNTTVNSIADSSHASALFYVDADAHNYGTLSIGAFDGYGNTLHIGNDHDTLTNHGTLNFNGNAAHDISVGEINNLGAINVNRNTYFYGNTTNNGSLYIAKNATAYVTDGTNLFQNGNLTIDGTLDLGNGSSLIPGGFYSINVGGTLDIHSALGLPSGGNLTVSGTGAALNLHNGATIGGRIVASGAGNIVASGAGNVVVLDGGQLITNDGGGLIGNDGASIVATGGGNIISGNASAIVSVGAGNFSGGSGNTFATGGGNALPADAPAIPAASIVAQANGTISLQGGSLKADNFLQIDAGGTLTGFGTANASLATSSGAINPTGGPLVINAPLTFNAGTISGTSPLILNNSLTLNANLTLGTTLKTTDITFNAATLTLNNNKLILQPTDKPSALATLRNELATNQITPGTLPAHQALALLDNALTHFTTFAGVPVDDNSLLLAPELLGDTNIDGKIDLTDLSTILTHFGQQTPNWTDGNFDNTQTINLTDLSDVLNNFGLTNPTASSQLPLTSYQLPTTATPEPTSLALLLPFLLTISRNKRRPS
ncbi:MAG: beta strand repeat-containing protein [Phycisphaerae bacterium]